MRTITFLTLFSVMAQAQNNTQSYQAIRKDFNAFEYKQVIEKAQLLLKETKLPAEQKTEVLRMKAIAHYVLNQRDMAVLCFVDILKINPAYRLDPLQNSPKLIRFFNKVKANYSPPPLAETESKIRKPAESEKTDWPKLRGSVLRSLVLPGWGHVYSGQKDKGLLLTGAAALSLSAAVFFTFKTNELETKYLNETNSTRINTRYREYNNAFHWRNGLYATFAVLWTYAQVDLSLHLFNHSTQKIAGRISPRSFTLCFSSTF